MEHDTRHVLGSSAVGLLAVLLKLNVQQPVKLVGEKAFRFAHPSMVIEDHT